MTLLEKFGQHRHTFSPVAPSGARPEFIYYSTSLYPAIPEPIEPKRTHALQYNPDVFSIAVARKITTLPPSDVSGYVTPMV